MISEVDYRAAMEMRRDGDLTLFIDSGGFRAAYYKTPIRQLSELAGRDMAAVVVLVRLLGLSDLAALAGISVSSWFLVGVWSLLVVPVFLVALVLYRGRACMKRHSIGGIFAVFFAGALLIGPFAGDTFSWLGLAACCVWLSVLAIKAQYALVAWSAFDAASKSHDFFRAFYMQPPGSVVPLLWTDPELRHSLQRPAGPEASSNTDPGPTIGDHEAILGGLTAEQREVVRNAAENLARLRAKYLREALGWSPSLPSAVWYADVGQIDPAVVQEAELAQALGDRADEVYRVLVELRDVERLSPMYSGETSPSP